MWPAKLAQVSGLVRRPFMGEKAKLMKSVYLCLLAL